MDATTLQRRTRGDGRASLTNRRGQAALSLLFFLFAGVLFFLPFARQPDEPHWDREDLTRNQGVSRDKDFEADLAALVEYATDEPDDFEDGMAEAFPAALTAASEEYFAIRSEWLRNRGVLEMDRLPAGRKAYELECAGCHGRTGDGSGPAATFIDPRPRNFRMGFYKFTTTSTGMRPKRADLFNTITRGLAGSAMPSFRLLNEERRNDIVEYVRYIAMKGEFEQVMLNVAWDDSEVPDVLEMASLVVDRWDPNHLVSVFPGAPESERTAESIARGRELYFDPAAANCVSCHGDTGKGDGAAVTGVQVIDDEEFEGIYDDWGYRMFPRDFSSGVFRAGAEGKDLYITVATGIGGTPMGSFEGVLDPAEMWDLIHFVQSLGEGGAK